MGLRIRLWRIAKGSDELIQVRLEEIGSVEGIEVIPRSNQTHITTPRNHLYFIPSPDPAIIVSVTTIEQTGKTRLRKLLLQP